MLYHYLALLRGVGRIYLTRGSCDPDMHTRDNSLALFDLLSFPHIHDHRLLYNFIWILQALFQRVSNEIVWHIELLRYLRIRKWSERFFNSFTARFTSTQPLEFVDQQQKSYKCELHYDYHDIITNPMCWSIIYKKLNRQEYWDAQAFKVGWSDIR